MNSTRFTKYTLTEVENPHNIKLHNHVDSASAIGNKKGLLFFMKKFYEQQGKNPFDTVP